MSVRLLLLFLLVSKTANWPNHEVHAQGPGSREAIPVTAEPWPDADKLFRKDPSWLGGDGAYSIDLKKERVLWLFADSFVADDPAKGRPGAKLIRNSVAIQHGYDPTSATINFYWKRRNGEAASFFPEYKGVWHWPGHGILLGDTLLIFLMKVRQAKTGLGFEIFGWTAVAIENPEKQPSEWKTRWLDTPLTKFGVIIGSASVLRKGEYVYAYGAVEPGNHDVHLVRWPAAKAERGDLKEPDWWAGDTARWVRQSELQQKPAPLFSRGQTEFTIHFEPRLKKYIQIQTLGFGGADLAFRVSEDLEGPWSDAERFFRPDEAGRSKVLIYAGKSHPELSGADLVMTYVVNSTDFNDLITDPGIYYPRFLKGKFTVSSIEGSN